MSPIDAGFMNEVKQHCGLRGLRFTEILGPDFGLQVIACRHLKNITFFMHEVDYCSLNREDMMALIEGRIFAHFPAPPCPA